MKLKWLILTIILLFVGETGLAGEVTAEKKALIDKVLEQTGQSATDVGMQFSDAFIQHMTMALKASHPDIDHKAFEILEEEVKKVIHEEMVVKKKLLEITYPIYDKYFTAEDLEKMIELNNTPFGKKVIRVMPLISKEGMQAGQAFGQTLGPKIEQRLLERFEKEGIK